MTVIYNLRLVRSIMGWMLVPSYSRPTEGIEGLFNKIYGDNWATMSSSVRCFCAGQPVENVVQHIKTVFRDELKIPISFCGYRQLPTIRVWWNPTVQSDPEKVSVDLKWSCWSSANGHWDDYSPNTWDRMEQAFKGVASPVLITTGPSKRHGSVLIEKGKASGWFATEWDDLESLSDTLGTVNDEAFSETIPFTELGLPGVSWYFEVRARTFQSLMNKIDKEEDGLIIQDQAEWEGIKNIFQFMNPVTALLE